MKKTVVSINTLQIGSTGRIMEAICNRAEMKGVSAWMAISYQRNTKIKTNGKTIVIGGFFSLYSHLLLGKITGLKGCFSIFATLRFISRLKRIKPDIIHLHNLHDSYINLPILFKYIKNNDIKVIWTLHDCWSFTGRCPYFGLEECYKWKNGCIDCHYPHNAYPKAKVDATRTMWKIKKNCFTGINNLTIVTPSNWLANMVKQSFLKDYVIKVIYNGIDLEVFKPLKSNFKVNNKIENKKIILGVAAGWEKRKGLDVFINLSKDLGQEYKIVLVGTNDEIDKSLPNSILSIHHTESQAELAEIYSSADVFVNPTRDEVFGLVNAESLACGTPVITFNTGGCPEIVDDTCGIIVNVDDYEGLKEAIKRTCVQNLFSSEDCVERAKVFEKNALFDEYVKLYL